MRRATAPAGRPRPDRLPVLVAAAIAWLVLADIPTVLRTGPLSVSGAATLASGAATLVLAPMLVLHGRGRSAPRTWDLLIPPGPRRPVVPVALVLFCGVAVVGAVRNPTQSGLQQTAVYLAFAGAIAVGALYSRPGTADRFLEVTGTAMGVAGLLAVPTYFLGLPLWGARSFALTAMLAIAMLAAHRSDRLIVRLSPYALAVGIAASLSRTALVVAILLLAFTILRSRARMRGPRVALALGVLAAAGVLAFTVVPDLRDRFVGGDNSVTVNGVALNTSGRTVIWATTIRDGLATPWFGKGAGSASDLLGSLFPEIAQPHNDYLRLWHDFGFLGVGLFVLGYGALVAGAIRRIRTGAPEYRAVHWAALLGLLSVAGAAITDNPFIYPFVMLPLGVVTGLSIAARDRRPVPEPAGAPARQVVRGG